MPTSEARPSPISFDLALIALVVFTAANFGLATRPIGFLAAFWPANAILLGLMVRMPRLAHPVGWLVALAAFVAADLIVGDALGITIWLSAANVAGALAGYLVFRRLPEEHRRLGRPISVIYFSGACIAVSVAAATVGAGTTRILFDRDLLVGFQFWFTSELVNYVIVLPLLLTAPPLAQWAKSCRGIWHSRAWASVNWFPVAALLASAVASVAIGGPGAFAYPMPALLWCAMTYSVFPTAVMTFLLSVWEMIAISSGILQFPLSGDYLMGLMSIRLAIALIALGPLAVAITNEARNELLKQMHRLVSRDSLTGAMSRQAFIDEANAALAKGDAAGGTLALLMLDIDHFKRINDDHGHAAGDQALKSFATKILDVLGASAVFGRLGGEEFAVLLQAHSVRQTYQMADRIRTSVEELSIPHGSGYIAMSVSGGIAFHTNADRPTLEALLARADRALYLAKAAGRNRIVADDDTVVSRAAVPPRAARRVNRKRA